MARIATAIQSIKVFIEEVLQSLLQKPPPPKMVSVTVNPHPAR
jgi:hypothetical protein